MSGRLIAIAGPVGAGKSTLVESLARSCADASVVHFDHYERMTEQPIEKVRQWMSEGADLDEMPVPGLAEALDSLKRGVPVVDPLTKAVIRPARRIFFETQFGRRHAATGRHIDFLVWIDTPLDVALARKVRQFATQLEFGDAREVGAFGPWLKTYLDNYLDIVGDLLRLQRETVGSSADLVVDGRAHPDAMLDKVRLAIEAERG